MFIRYFVLLFNPALLLAQTEVNQQNQADLAKQIAQMNALIQTLQHRVDVLEARLGSAAASERAGEPEIAKANQPAIPPSEQTAWHISECLTRHILRLQL